MQRFQYAPSTNINSHFANDRKCNTSINILQKTNDATTITKAKNKIAERKLLSWIRSARALNAEIQTLHSIDETDMRIFRTHFANWPIARLITFSNRSLTLRPTVRQSYSIHLLIKNGGFLECFSFPFRSLRRLFFNCIFCVLCM